MTETMLHLLVYIAGATFATIVGIFIGRATARFDTRTKAVIHRYKESEKWFFVLYVDGVYGYIARSEGMSTEKEAKKIIRKINPAIQISYSAARG